MSSLENCLDFLSNNVGSSDSSVLHKCELKIKEIEQACSQQLTNNELGFYCSILLQGQKSLLAFLANTSSLRQHKSTRERILSFLALFVSHFKSFTQAYFDDILKICSKIISKDHYSKNKDKALQVVDQIIGSINSSINAEWINKLIKILLEELAKTSSNTTSTVCGHVLHTLGILARYHKDRVAQSASRWIRIMLKELKKEMIVSSGGGDLQLIEGALDGLHGLLFHFHSLPDIDEEGRADIHKYVRMALDPQIKLSRYGVPMAAMKLLKDHTHLFSSYLIKDYKAYYNSLETWFQHNNHSLKHVAHMVIEAFFKQISKTSQDDSLIQSKDMFLHFIKKFEKMIKSDSLSSKEMSLAVQGYGMLAGPCRRFLSDSDVSFMCEQMITRCEHLFLRSNELDSDKLHRLPTFVNALGNIVQQIQASNDTDEGFELPQSCLHSLEQICILMIENYPRLHNKFLFFCHNSLLSCMSGLASKPQMLRKFQFCLAYQGLIRSCSFGVVLGEDREKLLLTGQDQVFKLTNENAEMMDDITRDTRTVTFSNYVPLWVFLLQEKKNVKQVNMKPELVETLTEGFISCFVDALIEVLDKLNLETVSIKNDDTGVNLLLSQTDSLQAENLADFKLFVNLCDLCHGVLVASNETLRLKSHVYKLCQKLVAFSTRHPVVSGFYRLLSALMQVCERNSYFDSNPSLPHSSTLVDDDIVILHYIEREQCLSFMQKFVIELSQRLKQFKDELLNSALTFVLSLPSQIASDILPSLVSSLKISCRVGNDYLPLAILSLKAITRWNLTSPANKNLLCDVVSHLEPFLHYSKDVVLKERFSVIKKKTSAKKFKHSFGDFDEINRKKVRYEVMKLFGSLGSSVVEWLNSNKDADVDDCVAPWDSSITVDYAIPFRDMKPKIRLDRVLWRVMHVAKTSSDRKAKISACELLHSIVLFIIGNSAQQENAKQTTLNAPMFEKIFPTLLLLACDPDQVCRQIFGPFINQVIHWFTKNKQFENPSTASLLNAIMDGLIDQNHARLRELCAESLGEFLLWSVKQNSYDGGYKNAKSILKRIYSFALHPSPVQRLGACLAFNSLYKVFRENDKLVDDFTLELFVVFINCLSLSHYDDQSYGTIKLCVQAISHLERIIARKHEMLRNDSSTRRVPRGLRVPLVTLTSLVSWLFDQVGRPQSECRQQCMRLFIIFIKYLSYEEKSPLSWVNKLFKKEGAKGFTKRFECGTDGLGIFKHPRIYDVSNKFSMQTVLNWFDLVLAASECYLWVFDEGIFSPKHAFSGNSEMKIFKSLEYFINHVIDCEASQIASLFQGGSSADNVCSPKEKKTYNEQKCLLTVRLLHFIRIVLKSCQKDANLFKLIPSGLWKKPGIPYLLSSTLVVPTSLGFDTFNDSDAVQNLLELSSSTITSLLKILPNLSASHSGLKSILIDEIVDKLKIYGPLDDALPRPFGNAKSLPTCRNMSDIFHAYSALFKIEIISEVLQGLENVIDSSELARNCFEKVFSSVVVTERLKNEEIVTQRSLSSGLVQVGEAMLSFVFTVDGLSSSYLVEKLTNSRRLSNVDGKSHLNTSQAALFLSTYSNKICKHLCSNSHSYLSLLCDSAHRHSCFLVINAMLDHLIANRSDRKQHAKEVCDAILKEWNQVLGSSWKEKCNEPFNDSLDRVVSILRKIFIVDTSIFHRAGSEEHRDLLDMYTTLMSSNQDLTFKNKFLDLLSFFCIASENHQRIEDALEQLVARHFPLTSREFEPGSSSFCVYSQAITKLLTAMQDSGAVMLFRVVIRILCKEKDHVMKDDIQSSIETAASRISSFQQIELLSMTYQLYCDTASHSSCFCSFVIDYAFVPIASYCNVTSLVDFFSNHVIEVMNVIKEETYRDYDSKAREQLSRKTCAYRLMELLFSLIPQHHIKPSSVIGQAYVKSQSQESIVKSFMKCATRDRKVLNKGSNFPEEHRVLHCAVYNALIAAVICTQQDVTWYKAFLFDDSPKKNQFFLDDVIDCEKNYYFLLEINEPLKKRSRFAAIRKQKQDNENMNVDYMASVYESSLSEDLSVFDSNTSRPVSKSTFSDSAATVGSSEAMETIEDRSAIGVSLECDELNMHECMPAMVALIQHMEANSIGYPSDSSDDKLPSFMLNMHRKLSSSDTHKNVRIFIARLIVNCASSFKRFAAHWIAPLANLVLRDDFGSNGINYMVCDVMATILSWNDVSIPEDSLEGRSLVQAVVEKLCQGIHLENRSITRHNLELIKTVLECWGKRSKLGFDPSIIYNLCGAFDEGSLRSFAGLQLLGAFLSNGIPPYTSSYTVDRMPYFQRIFGFIVKKRKEAYESASEAAGMALEYLSQVENEVEGEVHDLVSNMINKTHTQGSEKFITCLHKVALHHSKIVEQFSTKVFFLLPKMQGDLKIKALEILYQRGQLIPDLYRELKAKDFASMLATKDDNLQLVCCRLCHQLINQAFNNHCLDETHKSLLYFLPYIFQHYVTQRSPICRQELLDIAGEVYDFEMNLSVEKRDNVILSGARLALIKLLDDREEAVRNQVVNFWNSENHLPIEPRNKLHRIVDLLYDPVHEEEAFLRTSVMLILQSASLSPDYELPMFSHPLSKCSFHEFPVDNSWRSRHVGTSPMFVDTLQASVAPSTAVKATQQNIVKATQNNLQFSDTLAGGRNTYNWLTGNSLDTFASVPLIREETTKSSLIATSYRNPHRVKSLFATLRSSSTRTGKAPVEQKTSVDVDVSRLRQRFLKESQASMFKYAKRQEIKKKQQERSRKDFKKRLENEVQMHRKYREGELPDIEIPNRALVAPLAAACQYDSNLSRLFAPLLVSSIIENGVTDEEDKNDLIDDILNVLTKSQEKSPLLVGFVEDVCFQHHLVAKIDFSSIASASLASRKEELGIVLMEQIILSKDAEAGEPMRKKRRMQQNPDVEIWFEIARLYKSLGDYDVIQGIFKGRGASETTTVGLKLEAFGSFKKAKKVYVKALQEEEDAKEIEKDLWEDCLLNCMKNLCSWDHVDNMCRDHLSSYDQSSTSLKDAWKHNDYLERYLDSALQSKLILLLQGDTDAGNSLASFMDDAMRGGEERRDMIEKKYAEHLAILYIYEENYSRAKYYLERAMEGLSLQWTFSNSGSKEVFLKSLSRLSDVAEFLTVVQSSAGQSPSFSADQLLSKWSTDLRLSCSDSITSSYHYVWQRSFLLQILNDRNLFSSSQSSASSVEECKLMMRFNLVEVATLKRNFAAAQRILLSLDEVYDQIEQNQAMSINLSHKTAFLYQAQARHNAIMSGPSADNLKYLLTAHQSLVEQNAAVNQTKNKEVTSSHLLLLATCYELMIDNLIDVPSDVIHQVQLTLPADHGDALLQSALEKSALSHYKKACLSAEAISAPSEQTLTVQYNAYLNLTEFCHKHISLNHSEDLTEISSLLVHYVIKAMQINGSSRSLASLKFPLLFQLLEKFPHVRDSFVNESANLPSWIFLAWVEHMMALLDRDFASSLHPIVVRLSNEYPQAVVYPFTTSYPGYKFTNDKAKENKKFIKCLKKKLEEEVPLAHDFIKNLRYVADPVLYLKDWQANFTDLLADKDNQKATASEVMEDYQLMYKDMFDFNKEDSSLYLASDGASQLLRSKFAKEFKAEFDKLFGGLTGNKLNTMNTRSFTTKIKGILAKMKNFKYESHSIKAYSQWLASYQPLQHSKRDLEIPGQYHARSRPLLDYHVTIAGFSDKVLMMTSLRKPCRIGIRGSDMKEHRFLVKGGEDMRQDQRIESMFQCFNDIFNDEVDCRQREMSIRTYQVVPISSKVGVIEWMDHVTTFWDFLESQASRMKCLNKLQELRQINWVPGNMRGSVLDQYGQLMKEVSYTDAVAKYKKVVEKLPLHIFRNAYLHLSANPECFVRLRKRFVSSYSVMCVAHWLLGIGDRHTTNFVISTESGRSVGIDFGHAFGSASEVLPVPEMVPFRLTRQISGLLSPHDAKQGEMRQIMIRCLGAIRARSRVLLPILDVFIQDPSVDWMKFAKKRNPQGAISRSDELFNVYAKKKIDIVKWKLEGGNPALITCDELNQNRAIGSYKKSYVSIAKGGKGDTYRSTVTEKSGLDVAVQVDCLLDQATDPNILGRMWGGWKSWC